MAYRRRNRSDAGVLLALWAAAGCAQPAKTPPPADAATSGVTLPLSVVAGHLIVPVELGSTAVSQSVSLVVDLAAPAPLALRADMLESLKLAEADLSVSLTAAGGLKAAVAREHIAAYAGPLDLTEISRQQASALDDRPIAGTLGGGFLRDYRVVVDVQGKELKLLPRAAARSKTDAANLVSAVTLEGTEIRVPVLHGDGVKGVMLLSSADYASSAAAPADSIRIIGHPDNATIDIARYVAFRPVKQGPAPLRSGVDLLEHFRVGIDWAGKQVSWTETLPPRDLGADRAFFAAEASGDAAALAAFLAAYPASRYREPAAALLLDARLAGKGDAAAIAEAARLYLEAVPEKTRPEACLSLLRRMNGEAPEAIIAVGKIAAEAALVVPKSLERYRIHQLLGEVRLAQGDVEGAWVNFLTAAFGLPDDPSVNLNLARIYEKQGRFKRAWSRYQFTAALMEKDTGSLTPAEREEVHAAMERLRGKVDVNAS